MTHSTNAHLTFPGNKAPYLSLTGRHEATGTVHLFAGNREAHLAFELHRDQAEALYRQLQQAFRFDRPAPYVSTGTAARFNGTCAPGDRDAG